MSKITQGANGMSCIRCGGSHAYACHYNGPRQHDYGKGRGMKCHDLATAEFCHECDRLFSEGSQGWASRWERSEEWLHWVMLTNIRRMVGGRLEAK